MTEFERVEKMVEEAVEKSRAGATREERCALFFSVVIPDWNEHMAGEITLTDGRKVTIPTIEI